MQKLSEVSAAKNVFLFYNNEFYEEFADVIKH